MAASAFHETIRTAVEGFLLSEDTSHEAKQVLLRYAEARPARAHADPLIPMGEAELKLELIAKVHENLDASAAMVQRDIDGRYLFTFLQLTFLMLLPVASLRVLSQYYAVQILPYFEHLDPYSPLMIQGRGPGEGSTGTRTASRSSLGSGQRASSTTGIRRSAREREKCIARDGGACILTGAAYPGVCHIIPFALSANEANIKQLRAHIHITQSLAGTHISQQFIDRVGSVPGCSDKSWNMICLHPTLHYWWGKCLFALKCLGIMPTGDGNCKIEIQFHWMPRNGNNPREYIQADQEAVQRLLQTVAREHDRGFITESRKDSSRRLETGHIFTIVVPEEDASSMKVMIDIQWANTQLAAMSGAAGSWELPSESSKEPDPEAVSHGYAASEHVESWLENIQPLEGSR